MRLLLSSEIETLTEGSLQEVFGGNAVSDEYHIGRHVSNLFVTQTYEGQSDIHGKYFAQYCVFIALTATQLSSLAVLSPVFRLSVKLN